MIASHRCPDWSSLDVLVEFRLEFAHSARPHDRPGTARAGEDDQNLFGERKRLRTASASAIRPGAGRGSAAACVALSRSLPNCAKAASSRYCASSSFNVPATCRMALICALPPTRLTESPTFTAGRTPELNKIGLKVDLAVGDGDDVGRNVGGNVAGLRFDDGQRGQRSAAVLVAQLWRQRSSRREWR